MLHFIHKIELSNSRSIALGWYYTMHTSFESANKEFLKQMNKYSNLYYTLTYDDGEVFSGVIDCEPSSFWKTNGSGDMPLSWHLNTFWGNFSKVTAGTFGATQEEIDNAKDFYQNYQLNEMRTACVFVRMVTAEATQQIQKVRWFTSYASVNDKRTYCQILPYKPTQMELNAMALSPYEECTIMIEG